MTWIRVFIHRLRGLFLKRKLEQDLEDEIRSHIDMQIEDNLRQGMSPDEARYEALRKFGGVEQVKESYRDRRRLSVVDSTLRDLRYALRMLRRSPGFAVVVALVLVCVGIYGALSYDVTRRTHEIGIRMALGARAGQVVQLVLRETLWLVSIGVVFGLGAALVATQWVKSLLFGLQPHDPLTMGLAMLALLAVAAVAGYLPARRAARVDPLVALKYE
jgi:predicted lysophospholipase L1 biosynthesis ABC-type transport system permease subunit